MAEFVLLQACTALVQIYRNLKKRITRYYNKILFSRSMLIIMLVSQHSLIGEVDRALVALPDFKSGVWG